jgi:hypothetical protein
MASCEAPFIADEGAVCAPDEPDPKTVSTTSKKLARIFMKSPEWNE